MFCREDFIDFLLVGCYVSVSVIAVLVGAGCGGGLGLLVFCSSMLSLVFFCFGTSIIASEGLFLLL